MDTAFDARNGEKETSMIVQNSNVCLLSMIQMSNERHQAQQT